jgi:hypothetical protein
MVNDKQQNKKKPVAASPHAHRRANKKITTNKKTVINKKTAAANKKPATNKKSTVNKKRVPIYVPNKNFNLTDWLPPLNKKTIDIKTNSW